MPQIGAWLLANVFTALLPPIDSNEEDFYDVLGVPRNATNEQIRKAYKKQSLKLHPDKIAQRRELNAEEAAARYEVVQEAYGVLVNDEKRQRYHTLHCSPRRYRFVNQGTMSSPSALYENLTGASTVDKTRLVALCTAVVLLLFMQPILIASKVNHIVERSGALESSSWVLLLLPTWIMGTLWILFHFVLVALTPSEARLAILTVTLEYSLWFAGFILLAMKWDDSTSSSYGKIFIPFYLAMTLRWLSKVILLLTIRRDVTRMVTVDYLEKRVLQGKSLEELSEEEQEKIRLTYLVVSVPPDFEAQVDEPETIITDENGEPVDLDDIIELQKVEASAEYDAAMDIYFSTMGALIGSLVFGIVFMILLPLKLDRNIDASYWIIFIPIWIYYGSLWVYNFFQCACGTFPGKDIELQMQREEDLEEGQDEKKGTNEEKAENDKRSERRLSSGVDFVDPKHSITEFNNSSRSEQQNSEVSESVSAGKDDAKSTPKESIKNLKEVSKKKPETEPNVVNDQADDTVKDDPETDHIHIDEETFHAWQSAYEEAEKSAMEQQAKASGECFNLTAQLTILIMTVAKIEQSYWDSSDPNDGGFNCFWILFPFFVIFGTLLCCCACLIYGAEPGNMNDLQGDDEGKSEQEEHKEEAVIVPEPPSSTIEETKAEEVHPTPIHSTDDVETGLKADKVASSNAIDDLD